MSGTTPASVRLRAPVCLALLLAWIWIYIWQLSLGAVGAERAAYAFGVVPLVLSGRGELPADLDWLAPPWTLFSSLLLHRDALSLVSNVAYLWWFGRTVEGALPRGRFAAFFLLTGAFAALASTISAPVSVSPLTGAHAALSGVLCAYLLLHPRGTVVVTLWPGGRAALGVPALLLLALWSALQVLLSGPGQGPSWPAHLTAVCVGAILILLLKRRDVALFA